MQNVGRGAKLRGTAVLAQVVGIRKVEKVMEQVEENRGRAHLMQIVQLLILFALNMDSASVRAISQEIRIAGRAAKLEVEMVEKEEVHREAAHRMLIVHLQIRSAQSLDSVNVQHMSQVTLSAGVHQQQEEKQVQEAALQTPIAQPRTQCALSLVSANVPATSLEMLNVGAKERLCVELEEMQAAIQTPIVPQPIRSVLSLVFASAAVISRGMKNVGGGETLCVDMEAKACF